MREKGVLSFYNLTEPRVQPALFHRATSSCSSMIPPHFSKNAVPESSDLHPGDVSFSFQSAIAVDDRSDFRPISPPPLSVTSEHPDDSASRARSESSEIYKHTIQSWVHSPPQYQSVRLLTSRTIHVCAWLLQPSTNTSRQYGNHHDAWGRGTGAV